MLNSALTAFSEVPHRPGPMRQAFLRRTKRGLRFCVGKTLIVLVAYWTGAMR
jgi:hypothetical protein